MKRKIVVVLMAFVLFLPASACVSKRYRFDLPPDYVGRAKTRFLAQQLEKYLKIPKIQHMRLAVLPLFDLENLNSTSAFGQFVGEQLIYELTELGFNIVEIRNSEAIYMSQKVGELILQRTHHPYETELKKIEMMPMIKASDYNLAGIVCGTFLNSKEKQVNKSDEIVYVNIRIVLLPSFTVVSAGSCEVDVPIKLLKSKMFKKPLKENTVTQKPLADNLSQTESHNELPKANIFPMTQKEPIFGHPEM